MNPRSIFSTILLILISLCVNAQKTGQVWQMKFDFPVEKYKDGTPNKDNENVKKGVLFRIIKRHNNYIVINILKKSGNEEATPNCSSKDSNKADIVNNFNTKFHAEKENGEIKDLIYFQIDSNDIRQIAKQKISTFQPVATLASIPIKKRRYAQEWTTDLSLMAMVGLRIKLKDDIYFGPQFGIGTSTVELHPGNSDVLNSDNPKYATLSIPVGLMLEWDIVQIGVFHGWDFLRSRDKIGWQDNGIPWWGLGVGISIYNQNLSSAKKSN